MTSYSKKQIKDFLQGLDTCFVSDREFALEVGAKHLRNGKITKIDSKEGAGVDVIAFGYDELNNICAMCKDGYIRQYL